MAVNQPEREDKPEKKKGPGAYFWPGGVPGHESASLTGGFTFHTPDNLETQDMAEYASVLAHAVDTFGSRPNANAWLNRPNRIFANKTPLQILTEDPEAVEEELVRIDYGMFV